jgi:hypothetical protein
MNGKYCWSRWSVVLLALALAACNGDDGAGSAVPGDVTPPTIVSTLPVDGASGVARTTAVTVTFSEAVTPAAVGAATLSLNAETLPEALSVAGTVAINGSLVTFTPSAPSAPLALGTLFTARVDVGLTDLSGNALAAPFTFNFTTEPAAWPGTRQLGTPAADSGNAVATDGAGNVFVAGGTGGDFDGLGVGDPAVGGSDLVLLRFALDGTVQWRRQLGTPADDEAFAVAVDGAGNSYVAGSTSGDLDGPAIGSDPLVGGTDFFLAKLGPSGNLLFTRQLGTLATDEARGVAVDGLGNIYVTGTTGQDLDGPAGAGQFVGLADVFLAKFGPAGNLLFTRQLGTLSDDRAFGLAVDGVGNVYVAGSTGGDLDGPGIGSDPLVGGTDFFLAKFDPSGDLLFTRQLGTLAADEARGVAVDGVGSVYVTGTTGQDLDGPGGGDPFFGGSDVFLARFDSVGNLLFTRQLGTLADDRGFAVAVDGAGSTYVAGTTAGDLDGPGIGSDPLVGAADIFLAKFDPSGDLLFTRQRGTPAEDAAFGVAVARLAVGGNVFVTGETLGDLDGPGVGAPPFGGTDLFLDKFDPFGNLQ